MNERGPNYFYRTLEPTGYKAEDCRMLICVVRDDLRHDVEDTIQECNGDRIEVGKECDQGDGTRIAGPEPVVTKLRKLRWCGPLAQCKYRRACRRGCLHGRFRPTTWPTGTVRAADKRTSPSTHREAEGQRFRSGRDHTYGSLLC